MSKREIVTSIFDHNEWANERVLEAAAELSEEELTENRGADCGSLQDILSHMLGSHVFMLMVNGRKPPKLDEVRPSSVMQTLRESFDRVHPALRELAESFSDEQLDEMVTIDNPDLDGVWRKWERPRWNVLMAMGTHAMQHRGEAALILTGLGHSPGELDYSVRSWRMREE
jgi:uncharacterized damage-inducible protein DinB